MALRNCNTSWRRAQSIAMVDWDDFKVFSAIARAGSVRGAGKELGVNASTVTRRLEQLEQRLGVRLFSRTNSGLVITPEGASAVPTVDQVGAQLAAVEQRLRAGQAEMAGVVRVNVPEVFDAELFIVGLAEFCRRCPEVAVELSRAWDAGDLDRREVDLAVVLSDTPPDHLVGRPLGYMSLAAYARVTGEAGALPNEAGRWLASALEVAVAPDFVTNAFPGRQPGGYVASLDLQLAAVIEGMGATLLPRHIGDPHPQLIQVATQSAVNDTVRRQMWLLSHPDSRGVARVQAVAELIIEAVRGHDLEFASASDSGSGH